MKLIPVESIPKKRARHNLQDLIQEFVNGDAEIVKVDFSDQDYKSGKVCRSCLWSAVKRSGHHVRVSLRNDEVFLTKL